MAEPFLYVNEAYNEVCLRATRLYVDHSHRRVRIVTEVYAGNSLLFVRTTTCSFEELEISLVGSATCATEPGATFLPFERPSNRKRERDNVNVEWHRIPTEWIEKIEEELRVLIVSEKEAA